MLKKFFLSILVNTIVLMAVSGYMSNFFIDGVTTAIIASVLLSLINITIKPILTLLALPITLLSLGIFQLIVNAFMLEIVSWVIGSAFEFKSFGTAIVAAIFVSIFNGMINFFLDTK